MAVSSITRVSNGDVSGGTGRPLSSRNRPQWPVAIRVPSMARVRQSGRPLRTALMGSPRRPQKVPENHLHVDGGAFSSEITTTYDCLRIWNPINAKAGHRPPTP
jgi:hypothetical protein